MKEKLIKTIESLKECLNEFKNDPESIGFMIETQLLADLCKEFNENYDEFIETA